MHFRFFCCGRINKNQNNTKITIIGKNDIKSNPPLDATAPAVSAKALGIKDIYTPHVKNKYLIKLVAHYYIIF